MKQKLLLAFKLLFSLILLYLLYRKVPVDNILKVLAEADYRWFLPVFLLLLVNTIISAAKWRMFLAADGIDLPLPTLAASYLIGTFYNMFLPSNIGGDSYRIIDVAQRSRDTAKVAVSVLADRLSGFLAMISLGTISSLIIGSRYGNSFVLLSLSLLLVLVAIIYALLKQQPFNRFLSLSRLDRIAGVRKIADKLLLSTGTYSANRPLLIKTMLLSFLFQFLFCIVVYLLSRTLGSELRLIYFCMFVPLISLLEVLPLSINGIGLRDAGYVFFFGSVGMGELETRSLALLFFAVATSWSAAGGIVYLFRLARTEKENSPARR